MTLKESQLEKLLKEKQQPKESQLKESLRQEVEEKDSCETGMGVILAEIAPFFFSYSLHLRIPYYL